jgi:hypothetical protein
MLHRRCATFPIYFIYIFIYLYIYISYDRRAYAPPSMLHPDTWSGSIHHSHVHPATPFTARRSDSSPDSSPPPDPSLPIRAARRAAGRRSIKYIYISFDRRDYAPPSMLPSNPGGPSSRGPPSMLHIPNLFIYLYIYIFIYLCSFLIRAARRAAAGAFDRGRSAPWPGRRRRRRRRPGAGGRRAARRWPRTCPGPGQALTRWSNRWSNRWSHRWSHKIFWPLVRPLVTLKLVTLNLLAAGQAAGHSLYIF